MKIIYINTISFFLLSIGFFATLSADIKTVRPSVCFDNVHTNIVCFEDAIIDRDVVVNGDFFIDTYPLVGSEACPLCEECICPEGPIGPQGAQGSQGFIGDQGLDGLQGQQGNPGPQGIPTTITEYALFAIHAALDDLSYEIEPGESAIIDTNSVLYNDGWTYSNPGFTPPVNGFYELTYGARCRPVPLAEYINRSASISLYDLNGSLVIPNSELLIVRSFQNPQMFTVQFSCILYLTTEQSIAVRVTNNSDGTLLIPLSFGSSNVSLTAVYLGSP